jgi:hypothetical protein
MEEQTQWLHALIDVAPDIAERSGTFWSSALGWSLGEPWPGHPKFRSFTPAEGDSYIHQQIGDHGPRIHFDLEVDDRGFADRLLDLGAVVTAQAEGWCPMTSPGGCRSASWTGTNRYGRRQSALQATAAAWCRSASTRRRTCMIKRWRFGGRRPTGGGVKAAVMSSPASCTHRSVQVFSCSSRDLVLRIPQLPCGHTLTWVLAISRLKQLAWSA